MGVSIGDTLTATYGCMGVLAALHAGFRHIDDAEMYNNEAAVGAALAQWFAAETSAEREAIIVENLPERRPENNADYKEFNFFPDMTAFDPLDYVDPDADDTYDLAYAAY
jgi:hypothetical protein